MVVNFRINLVLSTAVLRPGGRCEFSKQLLGARARRQRAQDHGY